MNDLDWNALRGIVAIGDHGTLTRAAAELGVSQPTLGRLLDGVEARLGVTFFVRGRRGMVPTEAGMRLLERARAVRREVDAFAIAAAGGQAERRGTVRISASRFVSQHLLPPLLARIGEDEPGIEIELIASDEVSDLLARDADIAIRMLRPTQPDVVATRLGDMQLGAWASPDYVRRHGPVRIETPEGLLAHRLVGYDRSPLVIDGLRGAGLTVDRHAFATRTDDQIVYVALVRAGAGIGFLAEPATQGLVQVELPVAIPPLPVWLAAHRGLRTNAAVRHVADRLRDGLHDRLREALHGPD